jgi:drug/metabolite transporter (DMT)-like permease
MGMEAKKPYLIAIVIQLIYTGMFVVSKAAFDHGINTFVFIFYRMAAASLLLLPVPLSSKGKAVDRISCIFSSGLLDISFNLHAGRMCGPCPWCYFSSSSSMP